MNCNTDGICRLKTEFRKALKAARNHNKTLYLDLFAGVQGISSELVKTGEACLSFEISLGPCYDLTNRKVLMIIDGWISSGCIDGVWLATPCTSWSRARHGPVDSNWGPIRNNDNLYGLPNISEKDKVKIRCGNATMFSSARIIRKCIRCRVPCFLENPAGSMLWLAPPIDRVCKHSSHVSHITDFCQHGAKWRKRTRISTWFAQPDPFFSKTCRGRGGLCSMTGKYHIVLKGSDPVSKQLWTHIAQPYPTRLCRAAAKWMVDSSETLKQHDWIKYSG